MHALISLLLMFTSSLVFADEKVFRYDCGGAQVEIRGTYDATDPGCLSFLKFNLNVARGTRRIFLDFGPGFMHAACLRNGTEEEMIVFQHYCDGSGCYDLDNYGIVEPRKLEILLTPDDTNRAAAARILGLPKVPPLLNHPATVCCAYCEGTR
jgi:hypothetical protein